MLRRGPQPGPLALHPETPLTPPTPHLLLLAYPSAPFCSLDGFQCTSGSGQSLLPTTCGAPPVSLELSHLGLVQKPGQCQPGGGGGEGTVRGAWLGPSRGSVS